LEPGDAACVRRESLQINLGRPEPNQRLIRHGIICGY
jgi:hypothetical protein